MTTDQDRTSSPGLGEVATGDAGVGVGRVLQDDIDRVKEARAYTVEHFGFSKTSFVGHMPSNDFDAAVDHIVAFADKARELLERVVQEEIITHAFPGLGEDIAYALGLIKPWRCECGDLNGPHEIFCYRCGAGSPEEDTHA